MKQAEHDAFRKGIDFLRLVQAAADVCSDETDKFSASAGRALPATLDGLGTVLSITYRVACCAWGCRGGDHQMEWLAGRIVNQAVGAHRLIRAAQYDEALVLIRGVGEIANLLWLFQKDRHEIEKWKHATPRVRLKEFGPAAVRNKTRRFDGMLPLVSQERYRRLCEIGTHLVPGIVPGHYTGTGRPILGGLLQHVGVYMCMTELGYAVGVAAPPLGNLVDMPDDVKQKLKDASTQLIRSLGNFNVLNFESLLKDVKA